MARLIDYDEFKWQLTHWYDNEEWAHQENKMVYNLMELDKAMEKTPTIDAVPVKHGRWIREPNCWYRCSECGSHYPSIADNMDYHYCPYCGAKMTLD